MYFLSSDSIHLNYFLPAMSAMNTPTTKQARRLPQKKSEYKNRSLNPFRWLIYKQHMCA